MANEIVASLKYGLARAAGASKAQAQAYAQPIEVPKEPKQLLPKDILSDARMFSGKEAKDAIMTAIKKHSLYSHSDLSNQWIPPNVMAGNSSGVWNSMATSTVMYTNYITSTF